MNNRCDMDTEKYSALDLPALILTLRADLCRRFGFHKADKKDEYLNWLLQSGIGEYIALSENEGFREFLAQTNEEANLGNLYWLTWKARPDIQKKYKLPAQLRSYLTWFYTHGVGEHKLWPFLTDKEKQLVIQLKGPWQRALNAAATAELLAEPVLGFGQRPFGVNLVGYAHGQLGIGEDVRMAARALLAADVPMTIWNFKPGNDIPQNDNSMAQHVSIHLDAIDSTSDNEEDKYFGFNVFCLTALEHGRLYAEKGGRIFKGRYNIGYWPWELEKWPPSWNQMVHLVDEIWVSSWHTYHSVWPACQLQHRNIPVKLMPMAVELGPVGMDPGTQDTTQPPVPRALTRTQTRQRHGLPDQASLFCFSFDLNSSIHRKNPQAVVAAFLRAFPAKQWSAHQVGLVIKVHPPKKKNATWERLKALAGQDDRLHLIEETLPRPALLALYQACDCFVSLHRAEGFGRGIAEALQLGLHVITTGYSGNMDFCSQAQWADQVQLVRYRMIKVRPHQYPFGQDQVWANADVGHAAECMRSFVQSNNTVRLEPEKGDLAFCARTVGERYRARLLEICEEMRHG